MSGSVKHYQGLAQNLIESLGYEQALQVAELYAWYSVAEEIQRLNGEDSHTVHQSISELEMLRLSKNRAIFPIT